MLNVHASSKSPPHIVAQQAALFVWLVPSRPGAAARFSSCSLHAGGHPRVVGRGNRRPRQPSTAATTCRTPRSASTDLSETRVCAVESAALLGRVHPC